jgi:hypothetical protein
LSGKQPGLKQKNDKQKTNEKSQKPHLRAFAKWSMIRRFRNQALKWSTPLTKLAFPLKSWLKLQRLNLAQGPR